MDPEHPLQLCLPSAAHRSAISVRLYSATAPRGFPFPSPVLFRQLGDRFRKAVVSFSDANDIPWIKFGKDEAKLEVMQPHLAQQASTGRSLAAIGVAQEFQRVWTADEGKTSFPRRGGARMPVPHSADAGVPGLQFGLLLADLAGVGLRPGSGTEADGYPRGAGVVRGSLLQMMEDHMSQDSGGYPLGSAGLSAQPPPGDVAKEQASQLGQSVRDVGEIARGTLLPAV